MAQKYSTDAPEKGLESKERHRKHKKGLLSEKEATLAASTAPRSSYTQEYWDGDGELIKFMGPMIPLYLTPDILDAEFLNYIGGHTYPAAIPYKVVDADTGAINDDAADTITVVPAHPKAMAELSTRGGRISDDDKLHVMAATKEGRAILSQYMEPSDVFLGTGGKPMLVKDYYVLKGGISGRGAGLAATLKSKKIATGDVNILNKLAIALRS